MAKARHPSGGKRASPKPRKSSKGKTEEKEYSFGKLTRNPAVSPGYASIPNSSQDASEDSQILLT